jgi:sugar lactone lactonase YvrE
MRRAMVFVCLLSLGLGGLMVKTGATVAFTDHGAPTQVAERRGVLVTYDADGSPLIVTLIQDYYGSGVRTSVLLTNVETDETEQYWYPDKNTPSGDPFSLLISSQNKLYFTPGNTLVEFDIAARQWSFAAGISGTAMSFGEAADGRIYVAVYPTSDLFCFDPATRQVSHVVRLDPLEQYPYSMAIDDEGWIYVGIGTARSTLVAYNRHSGELRQLAEEKERTTGHGHVMTGIDGVIYGKAADAGLWYVLENGQRTKPAYVLPKPVQKTLKWSQVAEQWPDGTRLSSVNTLDKQAVILPRGRLGKMIKLEYEAEGGRITAIVAGPDGRIYGNTAHPMRFFMYDPAGDKLEDWAGVGSVGNFPEFTVRGSEVVAGAYANGLLYSMDTTHPWNNGRGSEPNPRVLADYSGPVTRPRAIITHPDGDHVIVGGFAGYGLTGGGLGIYNLATHRSELLTHDRLLPGHSTVGLRSLPTGDLLVGVTSVEAPGGGYTSENQGELYLFDWEKREVVYRAKLFETKVFGTTVPGPREIVGLEVDANGLVYALGKDAQLAIFDPVNRTVVKRLRLGSLGQTMGRGGLFLGPDGRVYMLFQRALAVLDPKTLTATKLLELPVAATATPTLIGKRLYFASHTHLWSCDLSPLME